MGGETGEFGVTLGVEEEYFLVDHGLRTVIADPDPGILRQCEERRGNNRFVRELLRSQIEANTCLCRSVSEVREALTDMRRVAREAAQAHGAEIIASSMHPISAWSDQQITAGERYAALTAALRDSVRQLITGGLHIHAGFGDPDLRIRIMTALRRYMPVLLALSTSSPFCEGRLTGYKSYRLNMVGNLPRTGIPNEMNSMAQFERLLAEYQRMKFVNDGSEIWWDIRPSHAYPTIELRICDVCPRIDDAMCVIALFASLIRALVKLHQKGSLPPEPLVEILAANKWLAQRYGVFALLGDTRDGGMVDISDAVERILEMVMDEAVALGCENDVLHVRKILAEGSSADRQIDHFNLRLLEGDTTRDALVSTIDHIIAETADGTG